MRKKNKQEEITEQLLELLEKKGKKGFELAKKTVLEEEIESKEAKKALTYFMTQYWHDVTRPALLSLVCEAVGGDPNITTPIAVSLTLISGAIDIHDDIIDQSKIKGDRPTVFGKFGKNIAILIGDALIFKGFTMLNRAIRKGISAEQIEIISEIIKKTFFELGDAEALELKFRDRLDITPEEYIHVVRKKAADVEATTRIGAIVGGGSEEEIEAFGKYGRILGMLVILRDDMIDMLDPEELIHRIYKEHLSLAIVYSLQNPEMKSQILTLLKKTKTSNDASKLANLVDEAGGLAEMHKIMQKFAVNAQNKVEKAKYNKKHLASLIKGMLLPEWRSYLSPPISNR